MNIKKLPVLSLLLLCSSTILTAQTDPIYINGPRYIYAGQNVQWYGNVELGPDAQLYIEDGAKVFFYGASMKLAPGAKIYGANSSWTTLTQGSGTGSIVFRQPNPNTNTTVQQTLDGGSTGLATQNTLTSIEVDNASGLKLINTDARIGRDIKLTNGYVFCGLKNLVLSSATTITNAGPSRFIVTDGTGFLSREGLGTTAFTYPVGAGAAAADYTPVILSNAGTADRFNVRALSTPSNPAKCLKNSWQITEAVAGGSNISLSLQHNTASNQGTAYTDATSTILRAPAPASWQIIPGLTAATTTGSVAGSLVKTMNGTGALENGNMYFTKGPDEGAVYLTAKVYLQGAWNGTGMTNTLRTQNLIPLTQPYNTAAFGYTGTETATTLPANLTDWVLIELRDASNPATVIKRRAAFLLQNGNVVDIDGVSPLKFSNVPTGNYIVGVRHRNHLGIRSMSTISLIQYIDMPATAPNYDFASAQNQAYQNTSITANAAQAALSGGAFGLWGGNGAQGSATGASSIRATGAPAVNDYSTILTTLNGSAVVGPVYSAADYNMNGNVRATGSPAINDYSLLNSNIALSGEAFLSQHQ
jgi:hypothetical protein